MKRVLIAALAAIAISGSSCKKELKPEILGRWEVISITEPDRTQYNAVDSPWVKEITFSFYDWHMAKRDNGPTAYPSLPRTQHFEWSQQSYSTYYFLDPVTKGFNVAIIEFKGQDRMVITETSPQFRQYVCDFLGK